MDTIAIAHSFQHIDAGSSFNHISSLPQDFLVRFSPSMMDESPSPKTGA
jgi:hypothetical protein